MGTALTLLVIAGFVLNVFQDTVPCLSRRLGLAQRLSFAAYFLWFLVMSFYLISAAPRARLGSGL